MSNKLSSQRAKARAAARRKRDERRDWGQRLLEAVAAGYSYEKAAKEAKVSVATVRRQVARAIAERPPEPAAHFIALQRERLNKALRCNERDLDQGEPGAVAALVSLLPHVERYWRVQSALHAAPGEAEAAQISTAKPMKTFEAEMKLPPLAPVTPLG